MNNKYTRFTPLRGSTSPNPSKGGEQATFRVAVQHFSCASSLLSFGEGGGRGASGLPRRSYLTARNDVKRISTLRRAMPHANDLRAFSPKNKAESLTSPAWGNALRKNKIVIKQNNK